MRRAVAAAIVGLAAAAATAYALGDGSVVATPPVAFAEVAGSGGSATAQLANTTATAIQVALAADVSCDPDVSFSPGTGSLFAIAGSSSQPISFACAAAQPSGMERCLVHATDPSTGDPLADLLGVCENAAGGMLVPSPTELAFGTVAIGGSATLPIALTNADTAPIATLYIQTDDAGADFTFAAPCNPDASACDGAVGAIPHGGSATILVTCSPRSTGTHLAQLHVATDTGQRLAQNVALACAGGSATAPVLGVTPDAIAVSQPVEVTSGQAQSIVRLTNLGTGTLQIADVRAVDVVTGAAGDWTFALSGACSVLPCSLAAGAELDALVTFDPSAIASRAASLLVSYHDTVDRTRTIPLAGEGLGATLDGAAPLTLDFGDVPVGHAATLDFALANHGNRATTAALTASPAGAIATAASIAVPPSAPAPTSVPATCTPTTAGAISATLSAASADAISTAPVTVQATCNGTTSPLFADPTGVALGEVRMGAAPTTLTFMLESTGSPVTFTGTPALDAANANLAVGALSAQTTPATISVVLSPVAPGAFTTHLLIEDTAGDTLHVPIAATVVAPMYAAPAALDVGTFCVGEPTTAATVALANTGTATLGVNAPQLSQDSPFQLAFTAPTAYPASLPLAGTATIALTPLRQSAPTTVSDTLTWSTDDASAPVQSTAITASFIASGGAIAPIAIDFGKVAVHLYVDDDQRVVVQNCNDTTLELDAPTIAAPFSIDSPNFPTTLAPNETATFSIGFHPTSLGEYQQTFALTSPQLPGQPLQVALSGESISTTPLEPDAAGPGAPGATSFYACNCESADPRGGWPIALAVLLLSARRRRGSS